MNRTSILSRKNSGQIVFTIGPVCKHHVVYEDGLAQNSKVLRHSYLAEFKCTCICILHIPPLSNLEWQPSSWWQKSLKMNQAFGSRTIRKNNFLPNGGFSLQRCIKDARTRLKLSTNNRLGTKLHSWESKALSKSKVSSVQFLVASLSISWHFHFRCI